MLVAEGSRSQDTKPALARRLAALLALAGLVGALLAVSFGVIRGDAWRVPVVLVGAACVVVGLWYALSRNVGQPVGRGRQCPLPAWWRSSSSF